ncbi:hypothetical protein OUZ56_023271 [Daphnia magna]|uniref:Uncharacterized protein n=1 Tax=Daphnia magna TaxID=35525 RepID=A0ABR0AYS7_9CRUS|nr:hypothetical protein OUZ56_023271 [Daphnia magna]
MRGFSSGAAAAHDQGKIEYNGHPQMVVYIQEGRCYTRLIFGRRNVNYAHLFFVVKHNEKKKRSGISTEEEEESEVCAAVE